MGGRKRENPSPGGWSLGKGVGNRFKTGLRSNRGAESQNWGE